VGLTAWWLLNTGMFVLVLILMLMLMMGKNAPRLF
jgi:hypothetical protein